MIFNPSRVAWSKNSCISSKSHVWLFESALMVGSGRLCEVIDVVGDSGVVDGEAS